MTKNISNTNSRSGSGFRALASFGARPSFSVLTLSISFLVLTLALTSCNKKCSSADPDSPFPNTVSITDNDGNPATYHNSFYSSSRKPQYPVSFSSTGPGNFNGVNVMVAHEGDSYTVQVATGFESPVSINLITAPRASGGTGQYELLPADADKNLYFQNAPFTEAWKCAGGTVTVTTLRNNKVTGTFVLNLSGAGGTKTVTGTFDANDPLVGM